MLIILIDGFGYLLLSEESVQGLNEKLHENKIDLKVDGKRFRPNIIIKGLSKNNFYSYYFLSIYYITSCYSGVSKPFEEDTWVDIRIGDCQFRNVKLCTRCIFTTVDPDTGEKHPKGEPLKTLRRFRSVACNTY